MKTILLALFTLGFVSCDSAPQEEPQYRIARREGCTGWENASTAQKRKAPGLNEWVDISPRDVPQSSAQRYIDLDKRDNLPYVYIPVE